MDKKFVIGIDEVGRGSLAGPVVIAAVRLPRSFRVPVKQLGKLKDSKQLSPQQREAWFSYFVSRTDIEYQVARIYPRTIERINISNAANRAAFRAYLRLTKIESPASKVYLDGGLYLGTKKISQAHRAKTIVKGDEKIPAIAAASIIAKVIRDRFMVRLAQKYPGYGFEVHKGYGTLRHREALAQFGISEVHRLTFLGKSSTLSKILSA